MIFARFSKNLKTLQKYIGLSTRKEKGGHRDQNVAKIGVLGRNTPILGTKIGVLVKKLWILGTNLWEIRTKEGD